MHILFEDNGKHIDLDSGCLMMVPSRKKEYNLVGERPVQTMQIQ